MPSFGFGYRVGDGAILGSGPITSIAELSPLIWYDYPDGSTLFNNDLGTTPTPVGGNVNVSKSKGSLAGTNAVALTVAPKPVRQVDELTFDAALSQRLVTASFAAIPQPYTVVVIGRADNATADQHFLSSSTVVVRRTATTRSLRFNASTALNTGLSRDLSTRRVIWCEGVAGTGRIYVNNTLVAQGPCGTSTLAQLRIGSDNFNALFLKGGISAILVLGGTLSDSRRAEAHALLYAQYGVTDTADVNYAPVLMPTGKLGVFGDSLSRGIRSPSNADPFQAWRVPFFRLAKLGGKTVAFVGTLSDGPATVDGFAFPAGHDAVGGEQTTQIMARVAAAMTANDPEGVVIFAGMNDCIAGNLEASTRLGDLVAAVYNAKPTCQIWLTNVSPNFNATNGPRVLQWNPRAELVARAAQNAGVPLNFVNLHGPAVAGGYVAADEVHPADTATGYDLLAAPLYAAVSPYLP